MKYNGVIQKKLAVISEYRMKLEQALDGMDWLAFEADWTAQKMTERVLQVMIEAMIDIAERIVALNNAGPATSATDAIGRLEQLGGIQAGAEYSAMARFRNLIVHQYAEVDVELLFGLAKKKLGSFERFKSEIESA